MKVSIDRINVHEHRAPTDESVRLLKEMEAAAQAKVDKAIRTTGMGFDCVVQMEQDFANDSIILTAHYTMGTQKMMTTAVRSKYWLEARRGMHSLVAALIHQMGQDIAETVLKPALARVAHELSRK